ncbi:hypothetical protein B7486_74680, partial [cyanobacterium TDX16]
MRFLGGEPFLAEENLRVWEMMVEDGATAECNVTTNGTRWSPRIERILEHLTFSFGVSIDGTSPETVARIRVGADLSTIMRNVERFRAHARSRGTTCSLTFCLMVDNWHELGDYLLLGERLGSDVFINSVSQPASHSLWRLPLARLRHVVEQLDAQDEEVRARLDRNLGVWDGQRRKLRHHLERLERGE